MKLLYQMDLVPTEDLPATFNSYWQDREDHVSDEVRDYAEHLVQGVCTSLEEVDELIRASAHNWRLERIAAVDRGILRMAVYELIDNPDLSPAVIINEAIEVAKRYSADESSQFINGVLDGVRRTLESRRSARPEAGGA